MNCFIYACNGRGWCNLNMEISGLCYCFHCNKPRSKTEVMSCQIKQGIYSNVKHFCLDTNCYREYLNKLSVRVHYRKVIRRPASNFFH